MDEYIRRQDAIDAFNRIKNTLKNPKTAHYDTLMFYEIEDVLEDVEPADVAPVRHGKWTHKPDVYGVVYCSECNYELHANSTSFCPNCGAMMEGGYEHG